MEIKNKNMKDEKKIVKCMKPEGKELVIRADWCEGMEKLKNVKEKAKKEAAVKLKAEKKAEAMREKYLRDYPDGYEDDY